MTKIADCTGRCRLTGNCDCGAIVNDGLQVKRVVRVSLTDAAAHSKGTAMQTFILDATVIDAEAAKPDYDWARGRVHVDGTPLDKHYARLNLMRASPAGQRAEAARDHYVDGLQAACAPAGVKMDSAAAYMAMCSQLENAWR